MKICAVIPTCNHYKALPEIVRRLRDAGLTLYVIDDGSRAEAAIHIAALNDPAGGVHVERLPVNAGKGAAVIKGLELASRAGFSHAAQIDADGQHDLARLDEMMRLSREAPQALVTGVPQYDRSIPLGRKLGRWITHFWVWVETLSFVIRDSMCGFRVYPVEASLAVWREEPVGRRMDFDTEIMVRLFWRGVPVRQLPVGVTYPAGNLSNFRGLADNVRISWMHTRLFFGMVRRLPGYLARGARWARGPAVGPSAAGGAERQNWANLGERGGYLGLRFLFAVHALFGRRLCSWAMLPVIFYFYASGRTARDASRAFLARVRRVGTPAGVLVPGSFGHFLQFGGALLDKIAAWSGQITTDDVRLPAGADSLFSFLPKDEAIILFVSHFGNIEVIRAIASMERDFRVNVLLHQKNAAKFARILQQASARSQVDLIEIEDMGPGTAMALSEKVARGEWVVIAADRLPPSGEGRGVSVPFLGEAAEFPQGPYILAHLLQKPVYMAAAWREDQGYRLACDKLADRIILPRARRSAAIAANAAHYARWLERLVLRAPGQWFNFYDFWAARPDQQPAGPEAAPQEGSLAK
ncbi:glycosyltransferase family 2 protein [Radicibacter daui]|uniref:glycosyltransferase family 2 protein n=1 Tax=Radicibacter daui TaxID=3064829 RepID=UPI004046A521